MSRKKLKRFADLRNMANVFDGRDPRAREALFDFFGERLLRVLEIGCGRGEYTLALSRHYPDWAVLGVDKNGARLWKGARKALEEGISNAAFLRSSVERLSELLRPDEVDQIWIPFPEPLPKRRQAKHRLVSPRYLDLYRGFLKPDGLVHLKTDDAELVLYAAQNIRRQNGVIRRRLYNVHQEGGSDPLLGLHTHYEKRYLQEGKPIQYLQFTL